MHSSILKKEKKSPEFEQVDIAEKLRAEKNVLGKSLKCVSGARNTITSLMRTLLLAVWMCMNWNRLLRIRFTASYSIRIQYNTQPHLYVYMASIVVHLLHLVFLSFSVFSLCVSLRRRFNRRWTRLGIVYFTLLNFMGACYLRLFFIQGHCHVIANNLYFTAFSIFLSLLLTSIQCAFYLFLASSRFLNVNSNRLLFSWRGLFFSL